MSPFTAFERRWIEAILPSFLPAEGPLAPREAEVDWHTAIETMAAHATRLAALGLHAALWLAALAPVWMLGRAQTIDEVSPELRTALLDRMLTHRAYAIRGPATLLKVNAALALMRSQTFRARTHYDPPARRTLPVHGAEGSERQRPW